MLRVIALFLLPTVWGLGFLATRWGLGGVGPYWLIEWRFLLAGLLAAPFFPWRRFDAWPEALVAGLFLFAAMALQTVGLVHTTVAKNAFLTALYAMFVPLFGAAFLRHRIRPSEWLALVGALLGVGLMCGLRLGGLNLGDVLTLGCAGAFSLHILWLDRCARRVPDAVALGLAQVMAVAAAGLPFALAIEGMPHPGGLSLMPALGLGYLTICGTFLSFVLQPWVQRWCPAHVAGVVFLMESPVAAVAAWGALGEGMSPAGVAGACLITLCALYLVYRSRPEDRPEAPRRALAVAP